MFQTWRQYFTVIAVGLFLWAMIIATAVIIVRG
jgi:hypothetical protein